MLRLLLLFFWVSIRLGRCCLDCCWYREDDGGCADDDDEDEEGRCCCCRRRLGGEEECADWEKRLLGCTDKARLRKEHDDWRMIRRSLVNTNPCTDTLDSKKHAPVASRRYGSLVCLLFRVVIMVVLLLMCVTNRFKDGWVVRHDEGNIIEPFLCAVGTASSIETSTIGVRTVRTCGMHGLLQESHQAPLLC